jgi:hypothetical protein
VSIASIVRGFVTDDKEVFLCNYKLSKGRVTICSPVAEICVSSVLIHVWLVLV